MNILRNKAIALSILFLMVLLPFACTENEKQIPVDLSTEKNISETSFVIGLLPGRNVFLQKKNYNVLAAYLSKTTGLNVKTKILDSYATIYNEMREGKVDAAFLGGLSYVVIDSKIPLEPIARPYLQDGTSTYSGVIFTVKDSGINGDVKTWKNKRIAFVNKSSNSGYVFPKWYLYKSGVKDLENYFKSIIYTGSMDSSITAVYQGQADIGCSGDKRFNELVEKNPLMRQKMAIIAKSLPLPYNTFVMKKSANHTLKGQMKTALLKMDKTPEARDVLLKLRATHFIETKESEYSSLTKMLNTLGLKPDDFTLELVEILHLPPEE